MIIAINGPIWGRNWGRLALNSCYFGGNNGMEANIVSNSTQTSFLADLFMQKASTLLFDLSLGNLLSAMI